MSEENYYTPGVCNLNQPEVAYRRKAEYLGIGLGVVLLAVLLVTKAMPLAGLMMFVPVWLAAIGYLQAKNKFCVSYAASGVHSASAEYADTAKIVEEASRKLDKARARKMNTQALVAGVVGAVLTCGLLALI